MVVQSFSIHLLKTLTLPGGCGDSISVGTTSMDEEGGAVGFFLVPVTAEPETSSSPLLLASLALVAMGWGSLFLSLFLSWAPIIEAVLFFLTTRFNNWDGDEMRED